MEYEGLPTQPDVPRMSAQPASVLRRARWACRTLFAALGVLAGAWGAHIPSIKSRYGLDEGQLALVLFAISLGAVGALFLAGRVIARLGTRRASLLMGLLMSTGLASALLWPGLLPLLLASVAFGMSMSIYDVAINAEGTELERLSGRAIMGNLHGMFSVGAMLGALASSAMLHRGWPPSLQLAGVALCLLGALAVARPGLLDAHPAVAAQDGQRHFVWPRGRLLLIGLLIFAGMTAEGIMYDWCVLFLKQEVGMPQDRAALGYAAFAGAMAVARLTSDRLRAHVADAVLLCRCACLAAVAMAVALWSGQAGVALVCFAVVGAGLAPVVPLLYGAASRVPGSSPAAAISAASSIGYAGFLIGPPLIGTLAQAVSLTAALVVVVVAALALAMGASRIRADATRP